MFKLPKGVRLTKTDRLARAIRMRQLKVPRVILKREQLLLLKIRRPSLDLNDPKVLRVLDN